MPYRRLLCALRHIGIFCLVLLLPTEAKSQFIDSIKICFTHKPSLDLRLDSRNSFISNRAARIIGVKFGLDYNKTVKIGIGYNQLLFDYHKALIVTTDQNNTDTVDATLDFVYLSPYFEYTFYKQRKWELSIPLQLGFGLTGYQYASSAGIKTRQKKQFLLLYEPAMTATYKFIPWVGVGFGIGYRLVLAGNNALEDNFNYPLYILKLRVFLGTIYRSIFHRDEPD